MRVIRLLTDLTDEELAAIIASGDGERRGLPGALSELSVASASPWDRAAPRRD
jgi:hypothetical protein